MKAKNDHLKSYKLITERILAALDRGVVPWRQPWNSEAYRPKNLRSRKAYRGVNRLLLGLNGYSSPYYVTYRQAKEYGGNVKRGERGSTVTFWKVWKRRETDDAGELTVRRFFLLRHYTVFNLEQCENIDAKRIPAPPENGNGADPIGAADDIIAGYLEPDTAPRLRHVGGERAYYSPALDTVTLPLREQFEKPAGYYATAFHELAHSTGHESRLSRDFGAAFGTETYAKEELIAEITSAFLNGEAGTIDATLEPSAAYLANWRKKLSEDPKLIVQAAGAAQRAADLILNDVLSYGDSESESESENTGEARAA